MWLHAKFIKRRIGTSTEAKVKEAKKLSESGVTSNPVVRNGDGSVTETNQPVVLSACMQSKSKKSSLDFHPQSSLSHNNPDREDGEDEQNILSVSDYPACGYRVFIDDHGDRITIPENQAQPLPEWDMPKAPDCVLRVSVTSADRSSNFEVRALFSIDAQITSVSDTLAGKLGLKKKGVVICAGLGCTGLKAYLPSRHVDITCLNVVHNHRESRIPASSRMALLIVPHAGFDLVLGLNWYEKIKSSSYCVLDFATDKARIHFLPKGKDARDKRSLRSFSCVPVNYSNYIEASWGKPDLGPSYNADPDLIDKTHLICPDTQGQSFLANIAAAK